MFAGRLPIVIRMNLANRKAMWSGERVKLVGFLLFPLGILKLAFETVVSGRQMRYARFRT